MYLMKFQVPSLQLYCKRDKRQHRCYPKNFVEFLGTSSHQLFQYIKVDKTDIKEISIQAIFVILCQLWKWFCMLRKPWKLPSKKIYQNPRNLQGKYLWQNLFIAKHFFFIILQFTVILFLSNFDKKVTSN